MASKVRLHRRARADLKSVHDDLLLNADRHAAERVRLHLRQKIMRLGLRSFVETATSEPDIGILSPTKYPYRIYYTVADHAVIVLHIRHTSRGGPEPGEFP